MATNRLRCILSRIKKPSWVSVNIKVSSDHPSRFLNPGINLVGDSFHSYSDTSENKFYFPKIALGVVAMSLTSETAEDQEDSFVENGQNLDGEEVENDIEFSNDNDANELVEANDNESIVERGQNLDDE